MPRRRRPPTAVRVPVPPRRHLDAVGPETQVGTDPDGPGTEYYRPVACLGVAPLDGVVGNRQRLNQGRVHCRDPVRNGMGHTAAHRGELGQAAPFAGQAVPLPGLAEVVVTATAGHAGITPPDRLDSHHLADASWLTPRPTSTISPPNS